LHAAGLGHAQAVGALIAGGAKVNESTNFYADHPTALHTAACFGHSPLVRLLLESGADASVRNVKGQTAAEVAAAAKKHDVVAVFTEFASRPSFGAKSAGSSCAARSRWCGCVCDPSWRCRWQFRFDACPTVSLCCLQNPRPRCQHLLLPPLPLPAWTLA
jgi:hypothetical protein